MSIRQEIEDRAWEILTQHGLTTVPVNPISVAKAMGIQVLKAEFQQEGVAGLIQKEGDRVSLYVNEHEHPNRQRFTIAHELGHYFLHLQTLPSGGFADTRSLYRNPGDLDRLNPKEREEERQANQFAAALLMPEPRIRALAPALGSIEELARTFRVSLDAMGIRLRDLGLVDG